jgi:hypothetical protein
VLQHYTEERIRLLNELANRNPLLLKDFALGMSRVEKLRERLFNEEMKIIVPFFRRHAGEMDHVSGTSAEDYALIFLNMLRGSDRLLTRQNGYERDRHLSLASADLFIKGLGFRPVTF